MIIRSPPTSAFRSNGISTVCLSCIMQLPKPLSHTAKRNFSWTSNDRAVVVAGTGTALRLRAGYFSANALLEKARTSTKRRNIISSNAEENGTIASRNETSKLAAAQPTSLLSTTEELLPHRRRAARKAAVAEADLVLPENSSSTLTNSASRAPTNSIRRLLSILLSLSKPRLSVLVVLTACASYSLYPVPEMLSPSLTETPSLSPLTLLFLTTGTALSAASANAFNMLYEPKWDAMMSRTKNRPLVRKLISTRGAMVFAILSGVAGVGALYYGVNPTVSFLGALNIGLYAAVYTPLKRISVVNTWVGAVVGGIPPLMGWVAAAGQSATEGDWKELLLGERNIGGWLLATLLVAWQFPHFMSLSWSIRDEYKAAGYKMLAWVNPSRNGRVALRYSLLFFPICIGLSYCGITEWSFAVLSTPVNVWLCREAVKFWRFEGQRGSARGLFWASVWHLPVVMILAMVEKKGLWQRVWRAVAGQPDLEDGDDGEWEDEEEVGLSGAEAVAPKSQAVASLLPV